METKNEINNKNPHKNKVHKVLAHSYAVYLVLFLVGFYLDMLFFSEKLFLFTNSIITLLGYIIFLSATIFIFYAQKAGHKLSKVKEKNTEHFFRGPYRFTRSPTHFGLFFLILGFGVIASAPFVILSSFISLFITKSIFLKKQEKILEEKYGDLYLEYKKKVKF